MLLQTQWLCPTTCVSGSKSIICIKTVFKRNIVMIAQFPICALSAKSQKRKQETHTLVHCITKSGGGCVHTLWHMYDPPFFTLSLPDWGPVWENHRWSLFTGTRNSGHNLRAALSSHWVPLLFRRVMHSPPVWGPFPHISHYIIQTKAIRRKGHHLSGRGI